MISGAWWIFRKDTRFSFSEEDRWGRGFNGILYLANTLVDIRHKGELLCNLLENLENIFLWLFLALLYQVGWSHIKVLERPQVI